MIYIFNIYQKIKSLENIFFFEVNINNNPREIDMHYI